MFSHNGKISEKQLRRMVVLSVFASIIFVLPYLSAKMFGESLIPGLLLFFALSGIYVLYIDSMGIWYEKCRGKTGKEGFVSVLTESGLIGILFALIQFSRIVIRLAFYILLAIAILGEAQVPFMLKSNEELWSNLLVVLPLLLIGVYGANTKVEKQGRIHEMLFWILFIPFVVMLLFGLKEVDYQVFVPKVDKPFGKLMLYGYVLLTFVLPMENYLYLRPDLQNHKDKNHIRATVAATIAFGIVITLFILGIYGVNGAANEPMTTIAIMRYIQLPFGIVERFDVLMIWFFIIGCFILICQTLYFSGHIFSKLCRKKTSIWMLIFVLFLSLGIVCKVRTYENGWLSFLCYGAILDIPMSILLPLLGLGVNSFYFKREENVDAPEGEIDETSK